MILLILPRSVTVPSLTFSVEPLRGLPVRVGSNSDFQVPLRCWVLQQPTLSFWEQAFASCLGQPVCTVSFQYITPRGTKDSLFRIKRDRFSAQG